MMDVSVTREWGSLLKLESDRKRWRQMVCEVKGEKTFVNTSTTPSKVVKAERFKLTMSQRSDTAEKTTATTESARATAEYRARNEREMLFRSRLRRPERSQKIRPPPQRATTHMHERQPKGTMDTRVLPTTLWENTPHHLSYQTGHHG